MKLLTSMLIGVAFFLTGCSANWNSVYRKHDLGKSALVDVKQRAIISKRDRWSDGQIVCAEPSPDALSAFATEAAGSASLEDKIALSGAISNQESAAYIGLRTQSIQLLRDALYRLCEGYSNGAIDGKSFELLARRYQRNMVVLLAIEQITGTVKVPPITLSTQGTASAAQPIGQLLSDQKNAFDERDILVNRNKAIDEELIGSKASLTSTPAPSEQQKKETNLKIVALEKEKSSNDVRIASLNDALKIYADAIKTPGSHSAGGSATASVHQQTDRTRSDQDIIEVTKAVKEIVMALIQGNDDVREVCLTTVAPAFDDQQKLKAATTLLPGTSSLTTEQVAQAAAIKQRQQERQGFLAFCLASLSTDEQFKNVLKAYVQ